MTVINIKKLISNEKSEQRSIYHKLLIRLEKERKK